jgi:hypothetical protein
MIGLKRFIRPGFIVSVTGHLSALLLGLLLVSLNALQSTPPEAILTDAMLVDVVPPNEVPRLEGTPADSPTSGSESQLNSNTPSAATPPPPPLKSTAQSRQQPQQHSSPQRDARQMELPPTAQSKTTQPQKTQSETPQPETPRPDTEQASESASPPLSQFEEEQPAASETLARLALLGGRLGGGFEAPAIDAPNAAHDFIVAFRERLSSCSAMPAGVSSDDRITVALRISFNPDGTLASTPQLIEPIASPKEKALKQSAIDALQKCQPYTMLPVEKYKRWKTLSLVFAPMNFRHR